MIKMAKSSYSVGSLTQAEISRLIKENTLFVREGEFVIVLGDSPIIVRDIVDKDGNIRLTKDGSKIRAIYVMAIVLHADGSYTIGKVTLSWLSGEDLYEEAECPLLKCKDGLRKYAATHACTVVATRDFSLDLTKGQDHWSRTSVFVAGSPIEAYKAPSMDQVWMETVGGWINKPEIADMESIKLQRVRRSVLSQVEKSFEKKQTEEWTNAVKTRLSFLGITWK